MSQGIGPEFMERTRYRHLEAADQQRGVGAPAVVKTYGAELPRVDLPAPADLALEPCDLYALITNRTSLRRYTATPLSLGELSFLLWCTQGIKHVGAQHTLRTVPSAGARHPFETMLLVNRVDGLEPALYAYEAQRHRLVRLRQGETLADEFVEGCHRQGFVKTSAVTFIWTAVPYRTTWRYADRGYRYLHLDAGHVCQNLYLAAEAIDCGACAIAAFDDDALSASLALDPGEAFVIYLATVGKRPVQSV